MPLCLPKKIFFFPFLIFLFISSPACAEDDFPFRGIVNSDNINIRSDSTTSAEIICKANEEDVLEVISELYGWYKIRLPKNAPLFINKAYVVIVTNPDILGLANNPDAPVEEINRGEVSAERINLRLGPAQSSVILGRANKGEILNILEDADLWYKITPTDNSFGWINSKFVGRSKEEKTSIPAKEAGGKEPLN